MVVSIWFRAHSPKIKFHHRVPYLDDTSIFAPVLSAAKCRSFSLLCFYTQFLWDAPTTFYAKSRLIYRLKTLVGMCDLLGDFTHQHTNSLNELTYQTLQF